MLPTDKQKKNYWEMRSSNYLLRIKNYRTKEVNLEKNGPKKPQKNTLKIQMKKKS